MFRRRSQSRSEKNFRVARIDMKLILSEFQEGISVHVEGSYDAKAIEVEFPDMLYTEPIFLTGEAEKSGGMFRLQGSLTTAVKRICGKCLKEKSERLSFDVDWIFDLSGKDSVEPLENVRELLIVEHPLAHLCKPGCRGLCPKCGINLNEATCHCNPEKTLPENHPFAQLKKIWKEKRGKSHGQS